MELWQVAVLLGRDEEPPETPALYQAPPDAPPDPGTGLTLFRVE